MTWQEHIKARLQANVQNLSHLSADAKAALVESELQAAVEATEAGLPLGGVLGAVEEPADAPDDPLEAYDTEGMAKAGAQKLARSRIKAGAQKLAQQPGPTPAREARGTAGATLRHLLAWAKQRFV